MKKAFQTTGSLLCLLILSSCTSTKLSQTWSDPDLSVSYDNILVVGISDSQQLRRAYETYFSDHLIQRGLRSTVSYKLIDHKSEMQLSEIDKDSFRTIIEAAVSGSDMDAVLITHLVAIDEEDVYRPLPDGPAYGPAYYSTAYYDNMHGYHGYVTSYVAQPGYYTHESTYTLETNLYDLKTEALVWTTRSRSFAVDSTDDAIKELTALIIDDLVSRKIIK